MWTVNADLIMLIHQLCSTCCWPVYSYIPWNHHLQMDTVTMYDCWNSGCKFVKLFSFSSWEKCITIWFMDFEKLSCDYFICNVIFLDARQSQPKSHQRLVCRQGCDDATHWHGLVDFQQGFVFPLAFIWGNKVINFLCKH